MDCFVALHRIIRVVAGVTSGSNLRVSLRYTLPKIRPRNDVKCAALSLAALNDFVCEANGTYVHLVKAMPQAAQKTIACFSLCLLLQLRALLETCKMASLFLSVVNGSFSLLGCSRITSSRALPTAMFFTLRSQSAFFFATKKRK